MPNIPTPPENGQGRDLSRKVQNRVERVTTEPVRAASPKPTEKAKASDRPAVARAEGPRKGPEEASKHTPQSQDGLAAGTPAPARKTVGPRVRMRGKMTVLDYERPAAQMRTRLREDFSYNDLDHDGKLTLGEFIRFMRNVDEHVTTQEIQIGFEEIDADHDGVIDFDEFEAWSHDRL